MASDVVDKILGVSGALSGVIAFGMYHIYKSRTETASQVRNIKVWHADLDLHDHLHSVDGQCVAYAAVEGPVQPTGRSLYSQHGWPSSGVMVKSELTEHRSKKVNGFWSDEKKQLRSSIQHVPFAITKPGGDPQFNIEVLEPGMAYHIEDELEITHDKFEPHKTGVLQAGLDRLLGDVTKGIQETEKMLLTGTTVLGVGKVFLDRDELKLTAPDDSSKHSFILTKMGLRELVRSYEKSSRTFKVISIGFAVFGGAMLLTLFWRKLRVFLAERRRRQEFAGIRRALRDNNNPARPATRRAATATEGNNEDAEDVEERNQCVVCLGAPREVITLNCGHISMCADCAEALPYPKKCPVCRADVERFMPVFHP